MTTDHRKADILAQVAQANVATLIGNLATVIEENETYRIKVAALEKQVADLTPKTAEAAP